MASPTSLLDVYTTDNYTRLVLKNPKSDEPARGGSFVYISVPGALGTDEAHAMTVALRGAPPSKHAVSAPQEEVFTLYVKELGAWTKALRKAASNVAEPEALPVDVDGLYSHATSILEHDDDGRGVSRARHRRRVWRDIVDGLYPGVYTRVMPWVFVGQPTAAYVVSETLIGRSLRLQPRYECPVWLLSCRGVFAYL